MADNRDPWDREPWENGFTQTLKVNKAMASARLPVPMSRASAGLDLVSVISATVPAWIMLGRNGVRPG